MNIVNEYLRLKNKSPEFLNMGNSIDSLLLGDVKLEYIKEATELLYKHVTSKDCKGILVYVDYDCDGATSAAVIHRAFNILGFRKFKVLVNKRQYGNGINDETVDYIEKNKQDISLVLTADHGTANDYHIGLIRGMGIDVIVTDHHQLPNGVAPSNANVLVNPQQDVSDHFRCLSGCAVAFLVMYDFVNYISHEIKINSLKLEHVDGKFNCDTNKVREEKLRELLDLVAISTIGDMMDLSDPVNRAITTVGMEILNKSYLGKGFKEVLCLDNIDSTLVSFNIVPMINSCSRVSESRLAYISLVSGIFEENGNAESVSHLLDMNQRRKLAQSKLMDAANKQLKPNKKSNVILLPSTGAGVNGIVASRISNETKKPTIVFVKGDNTCSGSGRAFIPDMDIKHCFDWIKSKDETVFLFENGEYKYGGHSGAAGCTVYTNKLEEFQALFEEYVKGLKFNVNKLLKTRLNDAIDITNVKDPEKVLREIPKLEPFGRDWENPLLKINPENIKNLRKMIVSNGSLGVASFVVNIDDTPYDFKYFYNPNLDLEVKDCTILCKASIKRKITFTVDEFIPN